MDPNQNTGSFGAATGGADVLKQAMARRGIDASVLDQMSPGSVAGTTPVPEGMPQSAPTSGGGGLPTSGMTAPQAPPPESDVTIAMKALSTVVTNDSKMKRDLAIMRTQGVV